MGSSSSKHGDSAGFSVRRVLRIRRDTTRTLQPSDAPTPNPLSPLSHTEELYRSAHTFPHAPRLSALPSSPSGVLPPSPNSGLASGRTATHSSVQAQADATTPRDLVTPRHTLVEAVPTTEAAAAAATPATTTAVSTATTPLTSHAVPQPPSPTQRYAPRSRKVDLANSPMLDSLLCGSPQGLAASGSSSTAMTLARPLQSTREMASAVFALAGRDRGSSARATTAATVAVAANEELLLQAADHFRTAVLEYCTSVQAGGQRSDSAPHLQLTKEDRQRLIELLQTPEGTSKLTAAVAKPTMAASTDLKSPLSMSPTSALILSPDAAHVWRLAVCRVEAGREEDALVGRVGAMRAPLQRSDATSLLDSPPEITTPHTPAPRRGSWDSHVTEKYLTASVPAMCTAAGTAVTLVSPNSLRVLSFDALPDARSPSPEVCGHASGAMPSFCAEADSTAAQLHILLTSWDCIVKTEFDAFATQMGTLLFDRHPEYENLFIDGSVAAQAPFMLRMVGIAVEASIRSDRFFDTLTEIGALHRRYNVTVKHFEDLRDVFLTVLPSFFSPEQMGVCGPVWKAFWKMTVVMVKHGLGTVRGDWYAAQRQAEWMAEVQRVMTLLSENQQMPEYRGTFIIDMLDRAEAANPAMARFCLMREHRTAVRAFEALVRIATQSKDEAERERYVEDLAHDHIVYGLTEWGLLGFRQPFVDACAFFTSRAARRGNWTASTGRSMGLYWDLICRYWIKGLEESRLNLRTVKTLRAPTGAGPFCLMIASVEGAVQLWEQQPSAMAEALEAFHRTVRSLIVDYGAYEVKVTSDSFVIAAKDVLIALRIALAIQLELMRAPSAKDFQMLLDTQGGGPEECWRADSLRVRIGIHYCRDASAVYDSVQRRYDYYGPSVNCTARVESVACGGQILMTREAVRALETASNGASVLSASQSLAASPLVPLPIMSGTGSPTNPAAWMEDLVEFHWWGEQRLSGISAPVGLFSVVPALLHRRVFPFFLGSRKVRVKTSEASGSHHPFYCISLAQLQSCTFTEAEGGVFRL